jgi:hypothetical protein
MTHVIHKDFRKRGYSWQEASRFYFHYWRTLRGQHETQSYWASVRAPQGREIRELLEPLRNDLAKYHTIEADAEINQIMHDCGEGWKLFSFESIRYENGKRLGKFYEIIVVIDDASDAVQFKLAMG